VWGPSGRIAFQGCPDRCGIHLINPDVTNDVQQLTNSAGDANMQWSPSGNELVYASNYSGAWAIYRVNLSNQFFQLTSGGEASTPTFSPDGSRIAFASNREGSWAIYIMNIDGSNAQKLIDLGPNHSSWQYDRMAWLP
jgi:Tol biopolymer transport system component